MRQFRLVHVGVAAALAAAAVTAIGLVQAAGAAGTSSVFVPITPCRLIDTRAGSDNVGVRATPIGAGEATSFQVTGTNGNCTIPTTATGIATNATAVNATASSYITIYPADADPRPTASNLNFVAGSPPTPNQVTVGLSAVGAIGVYNLSGTVDIIVDIVGYYEPAPAPGVTGALVNDDRYYTKTQIDSGYYTRSQLENGPIGVALLGRLTKTQVALGQWWLDPARSTSVDLGGQPTRMASDGTHVWVTQLSQNLVRELDPVTGQVIATVTSPDIAHPFGIAFDGAALWVANQTSNKLVRIDPTTATVTRSIAISNLPSAVAFDGTALWVTLDSSGAVRVDPVSGAVSSTFPTGANPYDIAFDGVAMWIANSGSAGLTRIVTATQVDTNPVLAGAGVVSALTFDGGTMWINGGSALRGIDVVTRQLITASVSLPSSAYHLAFDGHRVWMTSANSVLSADHTALSPVSSSQYTGVGAGAPILFDGTSLWVAVGTRVLKLTP